MESPVTCLLEPSRISLICRTCHRRFARSNGNKLFRQSDFSTSRRSIDHTRALHTSSSRRQQTERQSQAQPLGDFYTDLLAKPIPKGSHASSSPSLPTFVRSGDESKEERARKLFGNLRGSGYERRTSDTPDATWRTINGVPLPPRPAEPDNCCMSGCMHCVWDDYRDDIESWAARLREAQAKGQGQGKLDTPKVEMHRPEVAAASGSMDDDGGGSESLWSTPSAADPDDEAEALFAGIPVGIRAFMDTEKRIRERKRARKAAR